MKEAGVASGSCRESMGRASLHSPPPQVSAPKFQGYPPRPRGDGVFLPRWHGASWAEMTSGMLERAWGCQALAEAGGKHKEDQTVSQQLPLCPEG